MAPVHATGIDGAGWCHGHHASTAFSRRRRTPRAPASTAVRALPEDIPALPVSLVGNAMRLSMKVQQEIATLATRGDELLGGVIGGTAGEPVLGDVSTTTSPARCRPAPQPRPADAAAGAGRDDHQSPRASTADVPSGGRRRRTPPSRLPRRSSLPLRDDDRDGRSCRGSGRRRGAGTGRRPTKPYRGHRPTPLCEEEAALEQAAIEDFVEEVAARRRGRHRDRCAGRRTRRGDGTRGSRPGRSAGGRGRAGGADRGAHSRKLPSTRRSWRRRSRRPPSRRHCWRKHRRGRPAGGCARQAVREAAVEEAILEEALDEVVQQEMTLEEQAAEVATEEAELEDALAGGGAR